MDSLNPNKCSLVRAFSKVHNQGSMEIGLDDGKRQTDSYEKKQGDPFKDTCIPSLGSEAQESPDQAIIEAFLAQLFASITSIKAAYAQLQFAQSPYNPEGIQAADQMVVEELKNLSELKQSYLKKQLDEAEPESTLLLSEIRELTSIRKIFEITIPKLDPDLKLKHSEITLLQEKLAEANRYNKSLEKKLYLSRQFPVSDGVQLSDLQPRHFIAYLRQTVKSIRSFVRLMINEMESAGWDFDKAANAIVPNVSLWKHDDKCYVFESYVCNEMFGGFNCPNFSIQSESELEQGNHCHLFFDRMVELKSVKPTDYLAWKPESPFTTFCRAKYLSLIHPKMEASLYNNLNQRNLVDSHEVPDTPFFSAFSEMAKCVWLLHCLAQALDVPVSAFLVSKGSRFSEVYMESLTEEALLMPEDEPTVMFAVVPGFQISSSLIQCQVYL